MTESKLKPNRSDILQIFRRDVVELLQSQASPEDLSFVLAYVATELGLHFSSDGVAVFPVVLHGIAMAATAKVDVTGVGSEGEDCATSVDGVRPDGVALH